MHGTLKVRYGEAREIIQKATRESTAKSRTRNKHSAGDGNCEEKTEVDLQGYIRINVASEKHESSNRYGVGWTFTTNEERTFLACSNVQLGSHNQCTTELKTIKEVLLEAYRRKMNLLK